ncbi:MAG: hypothetical protein ABI045_06110 [Flavobacteriales bacterium]
MAASRDYFYAQDKAFVTDPDIALKEGNKGGWMTFKKNTSRVSMVKVSD